MYRFTVKNNKADHKPIVVFFCVLTLIMCLFLNSVLSIIVCVIANLIAGVLVERKITVCQPHMGVIILEPNLFRFENHAYKVEGQISTKSRVFTGSVWLFIKGFSNNHWLIISANGVDKQSYARLKRAVLSAVNGAQESK